jgi:N-acetylneuraminate synthase
LRPGAITTEMIKSIKGINFSTQDQSRSDYWQRTGFSVDQWRDLVSFSREQKIEFCLSVFSFQAFQLAQSLEVDFIKLGSGDLVNLELQDRISIKTESLILKPLMFTKYKFELSVSSINLLFFKYCSLS